jgi:hypothetical protein
VQQNTAVFKYSLAGRCEKNDWPAEHYGTIPVGIITAAMLSIRQPGEIVTGLKPKPGTGIFSERIYGNNFSL